MKRETENILLLLVGASAVLIVMTGTYTRYVKPSLAPWLIAAGVLIVALAAAAMTRDIRHGGVGDDAGHSHRSPIVWLLAVPVAMLVFVSPPAIGGQAMDKPPPVSVARHAFPELPAGAAPDVAIPDVLMRMAQDSAGTLDGRRITLTGFTVNVDGQMDLGRVVIICCAADAQLARIPLLGRLAEDVQRYPEGRWLRVEGEAVTDLRAFRVFAVTEVPAPPNPYAY